MQNDFTDKIKIKNPATGEEACIVVRARAWHYPQTMEDPEDSGVEVLSVIGDCPAWASDDLINDALNNTKIGFIHLGEDM